MDSDTSTKKKLLAQAPFEIKASEDYGRYITAKEDIPEKTLILCEVPLMYAPADDHEEDDKVNNHDEDKVTSLPSSSMYTMLFCLKCCVHLNKDEEWTPCPQCGWPLCTKSCKSQNETFHEENECRILGQNKATFPAPHQWPVLYKSVLVLRLLILLKRIPYLWDRFFTKLEHHNEIRREKDHCVSSDNMILENLDYFFGISGGKHEREKFYDERMTRIIIGVVNVNGFCANKSRNNATIKPRKAKCIFEIASLFAHSCAPNCTWTIDFINSIPTIKVYSSIEIRKSDLITIPYNTRHLFYGTLKRQLLIESVAHFMCKCRRCDDPTELGTFMSSPVCFTCNKGFLISKDTSNHDSRWICTDEECKEVCTVQKVVRFVTEVEDEVDDIQSKSLQWNKEFPELQKLFLRNYNILLHKNHYTLQEISTRMIEISVEKLEELSEEDIDIFVWHCKYLLQIADAILPGFNGYQEQLQDYLAEGIYFKEQYKKIPRAGDAYFKS